jgi:C4-dicarboxylate-specific signal transduction histidine kinase
MRLEPRYRAHLEEKNGNINIRVDCIIRSFTRIIRDLADRKQAEEALRVSEQRLREAQTESAHVSRVTTMGELSASIAHEVNQPLASITTNAKAGVLWLAGDSPNLVEAREAIGRIIRDANRARDVISRMRALFQNGPTTKERLHINESIEEVVILTQSEVRRSKVTLRTELGAGLPTVMGDRVQLQQVVVNLILNAIEAMSTVENRQREVRFKNQLGCTGYLRATLRTRTRFGLKNIRCYLRLSGLASDLL